MNDPSSISPSRQWLLERLALGELDPATAADVRRKLTAAGVDVDAALAELAASNAALLAEHPASRMAAAVRRRVEAARPRRARHALWIAAPVALAGALALVLWARPSGGPSGDAGLEPTRIKGPAAPLSRVLVYRHEAGGDRALADGARAAEGDLIQLAYRQRRAGYGLLLSIDGGGRVTVHWPEQAAGAGQLETTVEARLPSAYELDAAPGFERFFLVTAPQPFAVAPVVAAARALAARPAEARRAPLPLPASFEQTSVALDKPGAPAKELR